jgi:TPP-dependent pyruvate/acetoin dehydrogenase alpha subunit
MKVPVIVVLQDNQVALGTPKERHSAGRMEDLHAAYGVPGEACEGNNVLDVFAAVSLMAGRCRRGEGPFLLAARTFRMGGHATHDEAEARALFSEERFRYWGLRDPIGTFEAYLMEDAPALDGRARPAASRRDANRRLLEEAEARVTAEVEAAEREALESRRTRMPEPEDAVRGVYFEAVQAPEERPGGGPADRVPAAAAAGKAVAPDDGLAPAPARRRVGGDGDGRERARRSVPGVRQGARRAAGKSARRPPSRPGRRLS